MASHLSLGKQSNQTQYEKTTRTIERYPDGLFRHQQVLKGLVFTESTKMGSTDNELSASVTLSVVSAVCFFEILIRTFISNTSHITTT